MLIFIIMYGTVLLLALLAACGDEYEEGVLDCVVEDLDGDGSPPPSPLYAALRNQLCTASDRSITKAKLSTVTHFDTSRYSGQVEDQDLWVLEHCVNIKVLALHHGGITDISPLAGLSRLESLDISFNKITDINPLAGLSRLESLDIFSNRITDISPLENLPNLTKLRFSGPDFRQLADMVNLQYLDLSSTEIVDISPLAGLKNLLNLDLSNNKTADLNPLAGMEDLQWLNLDFNRQITDISPLAELKNLQWLNLNFNKIADINALSGLVRLEELSIIQNRIVDLKPLVDNPGLGQGDLVIVGTNPLSEASLNEHIPALEARGVIVRR